MNIPEPCAMVPPHVWGNGPDGAYGRVPTYNQGGRCYTCGHMWIVHAFEAGYANGSTVPPGCTQCQAGAALLEQVLEAIDEALLKAFAVPDEQCPDYPTPCNCDDPRTHGGH